MTRSIGSMDATLMLARELDISLVIVYYLAGEHPCEMIHGVGGYLHGYKAVSVIICTYAIRWLQFAPFAIQCRAITCLAQAFFTRRQMPWAYVGAGEIQTVVVQSAEIRHYTVGHKTGW